MNVEFCENKLNNKGEKESVDALVKVVSRWTYFRTFDTCIIRMRNLNDSYLLNRPRFTFAR